MPTKTVDPIAAMDDVTLERWAERAAILEFCAGYPRRIAEEKALEQMRAQRELKL